MNYVESIEDFYNDGCPREILYLYLAQRLDLNEKMYFETDLILHLDLIFSKLIGDCNETK